MVQKGFFFHLIAYAVLNSHVIYKMKTGDNIALLDFQKNLSEVVDRKTLKN